MFKISAVIFLIFSILMAIGVWQKSILMIVLVGGATVLYFIFVAYLIEKRSGLSKKHKKLMRCFWLIPISILGLTIYLALGPDWMMGPSKKKVVENKSKVSPTPVPTPVVKKDPVSPEIALPAPLKKRVKRAKKRKKAGRVKVLLSKNKKIDRDCRCIEILADAAEAALRYKEKKNKE